MNQTINTVLAELRQLKGCKRFVVALSGGIDSVVLLHVLNQLSHEFPTTSLCALHINHHLYHESKNWEEHCRKLCQSVNIDFFSISVAVNIPSKKGLESAARESRYHAFADWLESQDCLLLAQHKNDQVETLLLRLIRGSGIRGLGAMPKQRELGRGLLFRPLLQLTRSQLEEYAMVNGLSWVEDHSNDDVSFDRNYLRHHVIPHFVSRWPHFIQNAARTSDLCKQADDLLHEYIETELKTDDALPKTILSIADIRNDNPAKQRHKLRHWMGQFSYLLPDEKHLNLILSDFVLVRTEANPKFNWNKGALRRYQNHLYYVPEMQTTEIYKSYQWVIRKELDIPNLGNLNMVKSSGLGIDKAKISDSISVYFRPEYSENTQLSQAISSDSLKKIFQSAGIPPWLRDFIPLIFDGHELLGIGGFWVNPKCSKTKTGDCYRPQWQFTHEIIQQQYKTMGKFNEY